MVYNFKNAIFCNFYPSYTRSNILWCLNFRFFLTFNFSQTENIGIHRITFIFRRKFIKPEHWCICNGKFSDCFHCFVVKIAWTKKPRNREAMIQWMRKTGGKRVKKKVKKTYPSTIYMNSISFFMFISHDEQLLSIIQFKWIFLISSNSFSGPKLRMTAIVPLFGLSVGSTKITLFCYSFTKLALMLGFRYIFRAL